MYKLVIRKKAKKILDELKKYNSSDLKNIIKNLDEISEL